jgi:DNA-binding NarL/FixJ family response regulator
VRIVIAEDSVLLREGLAQLLVRFGHDVVATVGDGAGLIAAVRDNRPDVSVVDIRMPPTFRDEGMRAAAQLRAERPGTPLLMLSAHVTHRYATELLASGEGSVGYLLKDRVGEVAQFVGALSEVAAGGTVIDPQVVSALLQQRHGRSALSRLTAREREVLSLMAEGRANAAIARALTVTDAAVAKHVNNIFSKLGLTHAENEHRRVMAVLAYLRG